MTRLHESDLLTKDVLAWQGLHLFHYPMSSCSQKLRICLNLKDVGWKPHIVNLAKQENNSDWFMGINPRGLVPVLVTNGEVHIESNDILRHLEHTYPSPVLIPQGQSQEIDDRLSEEDDLHLALRTLSFRFVFGRTGSTKNSETLDAMRNGGSGQVHGAFDAGRAKEVEYYERIGQEGLSDTICQDAFERFRLVFDDFNTRLESHVFLLGDTLTVIDIAWFVYAFRLNLGGYPIAKLHPRVFRWFQSLQSRDIFLNEVTPPATLNETIAQSLIKQRASGRAFEQTIRI
jgi:glutathione S-transferase